MNNRIVDEVDKDLTKQQFYENKIVRLEEDLQNLKREADKNEAINKELKK